MNTQISALNYLAQKQGTLLKVLLGFIIVAFLGILLSAYLIARQANPIILDENGKPLNAPTKNIGY
jgi:hypothetical protein